MSDLPTAADMEEIAGATAPATPELVLGESLLCAGLADMVAVVPAEAKIAMLERIADCGFRRIALTSLSDPAGVPQFADAEVVLRGARRRPGLVFSAACPDALAVRRALVALDGGWGPEEIALLVPASEAEAQRSLGCSRAEHWDRVVAMAALGRGNFSLAATISVAFDCPTDGPTTPERVREDAERLAELGVTHIGIGDTAGSATPPRVRDLIGWLHGALPTATFIAQFADVRGTGIANTLAAIEAGLTHADATLGGIGGRLAGGRAGNTRTEDLAGVLEAMGFGTGLDLTKLRAASQAAEALLDRPR
ncbi:MAG: hydroxymethylglutaryl-CoA lyase [Belnapia sp.]|nr:hydroxymethylglutaryl-CoA lyase [Belnapia sp.]